MKNLLILLSTLCLWVSCDTGNNPQPDSSNTPDAIAPNGWWMDPWTGLSLVDMVYWTRGDFSVEGALDGTPFLSAPGDYTHFDFRPGYSDDISLSFRFYTEDGTEIQAVVESIPIATSSEDRIVIDARVPMDISVYEYENGDMFGSGGTVETTIRGEIEKVDLEGHHFGFATELHIECTFGSSENGGWERTLSFDVTMRSDELYDPHSGDLPDASLVESITYNSTFHPITMASVTYDGVKLTDFRRLGSTLYLDRILGSLTDVSMDCDISCGMPGEANGEDGGGDGSYKRFMIELPRVAVSGEPYHVTFDETSVNARINYSPAIAVLRGWITARGVTVGNRGATRVIPRYDLDLHVAVSWTDAAENMLDTDETHTLNLHIAKINSFDSILAN